MYSSSYLDSVVIVDGSEVFMSRSLQPDVES